MPVIYRKSAALETIVIARPIITTTTIAAFGSVDGYVEPGTEFGTDEDIMVAGAVVAADGADLTSVEMEIRLDGAVVGVVALYGYDGLTNYFQYSLGMLTEGTHEVEARFPRTRV